MDRKKQFQRYRKKKQRPKHRHITRAILDKFSAEDIQRLINHKDSYLKYYWDYYNDLAFQRSKIANKIRESLLGAVQRSFIFKKWQRAIKYKYTNEPLSVAGSLTDPGGRFNIGDINSSLFSSFPAMYLASDKDTAMQELLSQNVNTKQNNSKLTPLDFALTRTDSISLVSLSGSIGSIINLKNAKSMQSFIDLIKDFTISEHVKKSAKIIGENEPELVQTVQRLIEALLCPNWRLWPMQFDVPATSQIFGRLVCEAGIEGILFPSKFTSKDCLAIFPENFEEGSFITLDDEAPKEAKMQTLDVHTWKNTIG